MSFFPERNFLIRDELRVREIREAEELRRRSPSMVRP
jgi:hypothetical protein